MTKRRKSLVARSLLAAGLSLALLGACSDAGWSGAGTPSATSIPSSATVAQPRPPTTNARADVVVATGLRSPWGLAFLPNHDVLVGERDSGQLVLLPVDPEAPAGYG